jgi:hypothetical protein
LVKYIKAFINYIKLISALKEDNLNGLRRLKNVTEQMIEQEEMRQTNIEKALPEIKAVMICFNLSRTDVIKALDKIK